MSQPLWASVSSSAKWGCECMVSELRMLSVNWNYLILTYMCAHGYYICTWHWICLACMPCVHIDAPSLRGSSVGLLLCMLWGWGSSLNAPTGPLYFELPGLLAPGGHSWVPFQALPSADTSCLPEVLLPPQGSPPLLTGWFRGTETQVCVGNPSQGPSKLQSLLSGNWSVCCNNVAVRVLSLRSAASCTPEKICFQDHPPESLLLADCLHVRVCFLGKSAYNNVISWKWAWLLFEQWHIWSVAWNRAKLAGKYGVEHTRLALLRQGLTNRLVYHLPNHRSVCDSWGSSHCE